MRAREWAIVDAACEPAEYGIPELPSWRVSRDDDCGLAFVATATTNRSSPPSRRFGSVADHSSWW